MFWKVWKQIAAGKTLMRSLMNIALSRHTLSKGVTVDLGGGKNPSYLGYLRGVADAEFHNVDKQHASGSAGTIDFEKDALPYEEGSIDQVLMLNVLEHVYHHTFFVGEAFRILKPGKTVIGFVPFLINYHADPHDYFRYTHEALRIICADTGFREVTITPIGLGPFAVNFNTLASFMPRMFNTLVWPAYYVLDRVVLALKPSLAKRFPLGYVFVLVK